MSKKKAYLIFILLSVTGSVLNFYLGNFIFADIGNNAYGWNGWNILATIPAVMFCFQLIALTILFIRYYIGPQYKKRITLLYIRIIIGFSVVGLIGVFSSAMFSYGSLLTNYPFPYYLIIFLILNITVIIGLIVKYKNVKNMEDDQERKRITIVYVIYSACFAGFMFFAFYKFGALLLSPLYVQLSTLHMTWSTYLWLATPMLLVNYVVMKDFKIFVNYKEQILYLIFYLILDICLSVSYFITSYYNSLFISAISPAFGLDRLATNPYVAVFHTVITIILGTWFLIASVTKSIKNKRIN